MFYKIEIVVLIMFVLKNKKQPPVKRGILVQLKASKHLNVEIYCSNVYLLIHKRVLIIFDEFDFADIDDDAATDDGHALNSTPVQPFDVVLMDLTWPVRQVWILFRT